jgi:hypothetical protein
VAREDDIFQGINSRSGPTWEGPDPYIYGPDLRVGSRTSTSTNRTPGIGLGPLSVGSRRLTAESQDSMTKNTLTLIKARRGSGADTRPDRTVYASAPRSGGDPMLLRGPLPVT